MFHFAGRRGVAPASDMSRPSGPTVQGGEAARLPLQRAGEVRHGPERHERDLAGPAPDEVDPHIGGVTRAQRPGGRRELRVAEAPRAVRLRASSPRGARAARRRVPRRGRPARQLEDGPRVPLDCRASTLPPTQVTASTSASGRRPRTAGPWRRRSWCRRRGSPGGVRSGCHRRVRASGVTALVSGRRGGGERRDGRTAGRGRTCRRAPTSSPGRWHPSSCPRNWRCGGGTNWRPSVFGERLARFRATAPDLGAVRVERVHDDRGGHQLLVARGSAVAWKPLMTQAWRPRHTSSPTGRFVSGSPRRRGAGPRRGSSCRRGDTGPRRARSALPTSRERSRLALAAVVPPSAQVAGEFWSWSWVFAVGRPSR